MSKAQHNAENGGTLRVVRYKDHLGGNLPVPSNIQIHVLGTGARGCPKSIMISTEYYRYLFNCGEGLQRIATEYKYKLARLENIFFTSKSWENVGGLLGAALTLEANVPHINLHGHPQVETLLRMANTFNHTSKIKITMRKLEDGFHEDNAFRVDYVVLTSDREPVQHDVVEERMFREEVAPPELPRAKRVCLDSVDTPRDFVVAYIVRPFPKARKLILEKCVDLGIPIGPYLSQLKAEKSVVLDDGTTVHPDQVLSSVDIIRPIIVVECPSTEYLASLTSNDKFALLQSDRANKDGGVELIVHMTPSHVLQHEDYQAWMASFSPDTRHLILNEMAGELTHMGVYSLQATLNLLDSRIFPLLPEQTACSTPPKLAESYSQLAYTNLTYSYRPKESFFIENCPILDCDEAIQEAMATEDVPDNLRSLREKTALFRKNLADTASAYPRLVFLGTGASQPSKVRNVTSILVHINSESSLLLDCGEGTLAQIYRHYGDSADEILCKINSVLISHMHADHQMGTYSLVCARHAARLHAGLPLTKLVLLAPIRMTRWLLFFANNIQRIENYIRLVALQDIHSPSSPESTLLSEVLHLTNLSQLKVVEVEHCASAFGFVIGQDSWTLTYSGDTMPCERLVQAGRDCDVLIHEATMEDELEQKAKLKTHSTTSQALDIGKRMKAKFTILTHFSQRYPKIPVFADQFADNVGVAFDNMTVSLAELPLLSMFIPALKVLFREEHSSLQEKTSHYLRKHHYKLSEDERRHFYETFK